MAGTRDIKRRIKSINNTKKITKAMEMISSVKMRRSTQRVVSSRPYAHHAWEILRAITHGKTAKHHPLLEKRKTIAKAAVLVISSNRGLCGSLNQNIVRKTEKLAAIYKEKGIAMDVVALGKKAARALHKRGFNVIAEYVKPDTGETVLDLKPIIDHFITEYQNKNYDEVSIIYTDFIGMLKQEARVKQLLPFGTEKEILLGQVKDEPPAPDNQKPVRYKFEPTASTVLSNIIPRIIETYIYQALLESNASEHAARMLAMRNASDAAGSMIDDFTLMYNQARQASITKEIAEIAAGKAALE